MRTKRAQFLLAALITLFVAYVSSGFLVGWSSWLDFAWLPLVLPALLSVDKNLLTHGRYLVTSERIVVESRYLRWFTLRRGEWLRDLVAPDVHELKGAEFVEFGNAKEKAFAGHRSGGVMIAPLQLHVGAESPAVLGIVREAWRRARSTPG
ncbi:hypothetical protein [Amycolatopsis sp. PS_44_ISF1]|uniref:hypothetical protein n=1 Tax=Amycolatopsis sp. PS_44_ISF1 TaxID=2974917 RepID=UPI0028DE3C9A|nr:hypothetical protein [Amycolatopsis sp. PS_44_ISF1]MDT8914480.1 hypothetical protein [Amycolatopsis sp. PS_44_ISF1]